MFRQLADFYGMQDGQIDREKGARILFKKHPAILVALLEVVWDYVKSPARDVTDSTHLNYFDVLPGAYFQEFSENMTSYRPAQWTALPSVLQKYHLIYAYMIENTRIYEIFRRVLHDFLHGERWGAPSADSQLWLRNTEELFYRDPLPFVITNVTSHIRPDMRASRRNAYQRMFGMDLNHGTDDDKPYTYARAGIANSEFVTTFEEFLRELWVGRVNYAVTIGPRPIDNAKIANLAQKLHDMLASRRQNGNFSREEFAFVAMMSWFHLTVEYDLPIIQDLRVGVGRAGPAERLLRIAKGVDLPAHALSKDYFDIADPLSNILVQIETGGYNDPKKVPDLYTPPATIRDTDDELKSQLVGDVDKVITHWSSITGRDVKAGKVAVR